MRAKTYIFIFLILFLLGGLYYTLQPAKNGDAPPALTFLGRHSLVIYLLHQPVLYGLCWIFLRNAA